MDRWKNRTARRNLIVAVLAAIGAIVAALVFETHAWFRIAALAILGLIIVLLLIVLALALKRPPEPVKSRPLILFREPSVEQRTVQQSWYDNYSLPVTGIGHYPDLDPGVATVWCVYAQVENVPQVGDDGSQPAASNVHVSLRFMNDAGDIIKEMRGRWAHHLQGLIVEATQAPATTDLLPNGGPSNIDVAIKYWTDRECFAWNDETRFETEDLRGVGLGREPIIVEIHLDGAGVSANATYVLAHDGVGADRPTLTRVA